MSERDLLAPVISGLDCSGIVNRYSLQCDPFFVEGDNGGTLLDGSTVHDVLARKSRLSWTLNALSSAQYAELQDACGSQNSDTVGAYVFDPVCNAVRFAMFHVTPPAFQYAFHTKNPMAFAGTELVLEEADSVHLFVFAPPSVTQYFLGDSLDLSGLSVTRYDKAGNAVDITDQCAVSPADNAPLVRLGPAVVRVRLDGVEFWRVPLSVRLGDIVANGDFWELDDGGRLYVHYPGAMPDFIAGYAREWRNNKNNIESAIIAPGVSNIGDNAFFECYHLKQVSIPDGVATIGQFAFYYCSSLTNVSVPKSVKAVSDSAFSCCYNLTSAIIANGVATIGRNAFSACESLSNLVLPNSVATLGPLAFSDCSSLTSVSIPDSVTNLGERVFEDCYRLENAVIGRGIDTIPTRAFDGCSHLTTVSISDSVSVIEKSAFFNCSSLADVYYAGSSDDWSGVEIGDYNEALTSAAVHFNTSGPASENGGAL